MILSGEMVHSRVESINLDRNFQKYADVDYQLMNRDEFRELE